MTYCTKENLIMESDKNYILMMFNWKIIGIVLLYTIVMISWLPIII